MTAGVLGREVYLLSAHQGALGGEQRHELLGPPGMSEERFKELLVSSAPAAAQRALDAKREANDDHELLWGDVVPELAAALCALHGFEEVRPSYTFAIFSEGRLSAELREAPSNAAWQECRALAHRIRDAATAALE